jgi:hypothetical protein
MTTGAALKTVPRQKMDQVTKAANFMGNFFAPHTFIAPPPRSQWMRQTIAASAGAGKKETTHFDENLAA